MFQLLGNALVAGDLKVLNRALSSLKEFEGSVSGFVDFKSGNDENRNVDAGVCGSGGVDDCSDNLNAGVCGSSTGLSTSAHAENFSQVVIIIDGDIDDNPSETIGRDTALNEAYKSKSLSKAKSRSEPMVERAHGKPPATQENYCETKKVCSEKAIGEPETDMSEREQARPPAAFSLTTLAEAVDSEMLSYPEWSTFLAKFEVDDDLPDVTAPKHYAFLFLHLGLMMNTNILKLLRSC
ncbi:hypothetical protein PC129_g11027 [Phytophthora cactorum]|uniref:Uncharacterized protein n=1 Tax=Phytophthora cactorum TaxID=29920 RepID=A0A8T0Z190_9STRA|nr:hypothetical protein PC112_g12735 [Phytophthora cactorum]KAG2822491.1 hypothetical protein PC111_g10602 [Phytophthora cactorum]KAG2855662.1 hypothetical protein PC113_g12252 [Phytophthora cactorum]KAG2902103.1 hypothetical protein PC114_g12868 [Phytophthora cactorum]KAG2922061.1 hypothetical protein PC115_g9332 [Phytophthora cactorum]